MLLSILQIKQWPSGSPSPAASQHQAGLIQWRIRRTAPGHCFKGNNKEQCPPEYIFNLTYSLYRVFDRCRTPIIDTCLSRDDFVLLASLSRRLLCFQKLEGQTFFVWENTLQTPIVQAPCGRAGRAPTCSILVFTKHSNSSTNSFSCGLVVSSDDDHTNPCISTILHGLVHFHARRIQHSDDTNKSDSSLETKSTFF